MRVSLHDPKRVEPNRVLVTRNLLLLEPPLRELDLVRKQVASGQRMAQSKHRPERAEALGRLPVRAVAVVNLDEPVVVHVAGEPRHAVSRHLVLEIDVRDRRAQLVRVQVLLRRDMPELDTRARRHVLQRLILVVEMIVALGCCVHDLPIVVRVPVGVEGDLLLLAASRVLMVMRVKITTLSIDVTNGDGRA